MSNERENRQRRRHSRLPYAIALVAMGVLVVLAWLGKGTLRPVIAGEPAPEFTATNLAGEPVRLSDYRGKVVLLNVWATWCEPCRLEMPSMERLRQMVHAMPGGEDFEILAVSVDATLEKPDALGRGVKAGDLETFAHELGLTFPIVHNAAGDVQSLFQTTGVPESFIVDRDGVIYYKYAGPTEWDVPQHLELIRRLLDS
jgi:cytochrome c biogenesis protein CcmG/thiol:disulfide interchange protein DsbE